MRVLTITSLFPNSKQKNHGIFVLNRIKGMKKYCDVEVIAPIPYFPFFKKNRPRNVPFYEEIEGISVYHPKFFSIPKFFKFLDGWFFYLSLKKFSKMSEEVDVIDTHFGWPDGYGSYLFAKKNKKKISLTLRGRDLSYWQHQSLIKNKVKRMLRGSNYLITVSNSLKERIVGKVKNKVKVISNGVDLKKFYFKSKKKCRKNLGISENKNVFLSVGNDFRRKGMFELVRSFKKLDLENKMLIIVGKDHSFSDLKKFINGDKSIKLVGKIENSKLIDFYNSADVYCLVSNSEGWPNSVMEALACLKPCVVTNEAAGEFITKDLGIITDYENLKDSLEVAIYNKWNKNKIKNFISKKSWDSCGKEVVDFFNKSNLNQGNKK